MTDKKLIAFAQGYLACIPCREYIPAVEDWVEWDKSPRDLGYEGECTPEQAIAALKDWLTTP